MANGKTPLADEAQHDPWINAAETCRLSGGISGMTLHRWLGRPDLNFPKPTKINGRRYWRQSAVVDWWEARESVAA